MKNAEELLSLITLERIEDNIFRGESYKTSWKMVFGGQVLAQALHAAYQTVPNTRVAHSMHGYFILPGDIYQPIVYIVEYTRDGGSFTTRRVRAVQKGKDIFVMAVSFQVEEEGFEHQIMKPDVPSPHELPTDAELAEMLKDKAPMIAKRLQIDRPIEFRPVEKMRWLRPEKQEPFRHVWIKAKGKLPDIKQLHQQVLAYASDYNLLTTAIQPHRHEVDYHELRLASLDHAMWFHREFRADQWLLFALDSPSASNARGFTRGNFFDEKGRLVASVVQEGLIRKSRKK